MRKFLFSILIVEITFIFACVHLLRAQAPDISVDLIFDKSLYTLKDPVGVSVVVTNNTGRNVYISKDFLDRIYYLEMRVIDPAGRLVLPIRTETNTEIPDAPPLPFCQKNNVFTQVAPYVILPAGWSYTSQTDDLKEFFPLKLPGTYSFQVQLPAMTWNPAQGEPCIGDINNYEYLGTFKSQTQYISSQGSTKILLIPTEWLIDWKDEVIIPRPEISAVIVPGEYQSVDDYNLEHIQLNNVVANMVWKQYSYKHNIHYLRAFFNRKDAINSLSNNIVAGQRFPVIISGTMKNGNFFGGGAYVTVISQ